MLSLDEVAVRSDRVICTSLRDIRSESYTSFVQRSVLNKLHGRLPILIDLNWL